MKRKYKILISLLSFISMYDVANAYVDKNGNVSTQYLLDYETLEKTYFEIENKSELLEYMNENVLSQVSYSEDESGVIVEADIKNAVFCDAVLDIGYYDRVVPGKYLWNVNYQDLPADYYWDECVQYGIDLTSMLPGLEFLSFIKPDKTLADVQFTILELETKEIGQIPLIGWYYYDIGKPQRVSHENTAYDQFIPSLLYDRCERLSDPSKTGYPYPFVHTVLYFGQVRESDWTLRAVTHIKLHISNCLLYNTGIEYVADGGADVRPRYFNMQGMEVQQPEHGKMYIIREGSKSRKAIYR